MQANLSHMLIFQLLWSISLTIFRSWLTHWGQDKMAAIFQTFSNVFSWMKMYQFWLISFSLKFVPKGPISNVPALVQIMAWHLPGDKPLSEPMMVSLLTHICVTRPQWVKIWSRICAYVVPVLVIRLLQNFAHVMCHVQNFVKIMSLEFGWELNEISRNLN